MFTSEPRLSFAKQRALKREKEDDLNRWTMLLDALEGWINRILHKITVLRSKRYLKPGSESRRGDLYSREMKVRLSDQLMV